jgi:hypothetical protein
MALLGHASPDMTLRYLEATLSDLQREIQPARSHPRHLVPQPKAPLAAIRFGLDGVIDSLLTTQHVLEMFSTRTSGRHLPSLPRPAPNRLSKILTEARKLITP